ncbi:hypothetical protein E0W45_06130 [Neisseria meningitidis]|nr:hypothetical protein [Neisseria meningitidis]MBJ7859462.1 hypothetical protein [Neisseria meningitidis]
MPETSKKPKPNKPDSRLRGNDGRTVSVFSDKCRNLKSRHSREPTSRHSHESGNLESLKLQLTFEYYCCSKV